MIYKVGAGSLFYLRTMDSEETSIDRIKETGTQESDDPATQWSKSQMTVLILCCLFFIKVILPFISLVLLFSSAMLVMLAASIVFVRLPKYEEAHIRTQFPRFKFTRTEHWNKEIELITAQAGFDDDSSRSKFHQSLDPLVNYITKNFISSWFESVSNDDTFPSEVRSQLKYTFSKLEARATKVDWSTFLVVIITPLLTRHYSNYHSAEDNVLSDTIQLGSRDLNILIAKEYNNISKLSQFISFTSFDNDHEKKLYARDRVMKISQYILPSSELGSDPVRVLIREILTNAVFCPVLNILSDSDFWNQTIVKVVSSTLQDRTKVREVRDAIDKQYNSPHTIKPKQAYKGPLFQQRIKPDMTSSEFHRYMKLIEKTDSLSSLQQLKYYNAVQISRTHMIQSNSPKFLKYKKRLDIVKVTVDKMIETLDACSKDGDTRKSTLQQYDLDSFISKLSLSQILSNPTSLSFFMEFIEQRSRSVLLQYWIAVNSIRDPLEDPRNADYEEELSSSVDMGGEQDIKTIFTRFFSDKLLRIKPDIFKEVEAFVNGNERSLETYVKVRKIILMLQLEVFHRMEERDLPDFKGSELFLKLLTNESFEQSLVNEVDAPHDEITEHDIYVPNSDEDERSLLELENALTDILSKPGEGSIFSSSTNDDSRNQQDLKSDLFGDQSNGFLSEKPLFNDEDDVDSTADLESQTDLRVDPQFFSVSHDALNLKEEISRLETEIEKLRQQSEMLDPLILKSELTNNANELRILRKSKMSFDQEIDSKELMKQQLIVQENENSLYGRTKVRIKSWVKSHDNGRDYVLYIIEVERDHTLEGKPGTSWMIARRFNQFYQMNEVLKREYPEIEAITFPKKKIVLKFQQRSVLEERKKQLEEYITRLLENPKVCQNKEFRKFLTNDDYNLSNEMDSGISTPAKAVVEAANTRSSSFTNIAAEASFINDTEQTDDLRRELETFESDRTRGKSFLKPIVELFIALFPMNSTNSWLRGRAIIVILQKLLGNTIEKYIKDQIVALTSEDKLIELNSLLTDTLWPSGEFMKSGEVRTTIDKHRTKREAKHLLETLTVDTLSTFVGQSSSKTAAGRIYGMLQNDLLNLSLTYDILDKTFEALFPELNLTET